MNNLNLKKQDQIKGIKEICTYLQSFDFINLKPFVLYSNVYFLIDLAHSAKLNFSMGSPLFEIQHTLKKELEFSLEDNRNVHPIQAIQHQCQKLLETL